MIPLLNPAPDRGPVSFSFPSFPFFPPFLLISPFMWKRIYTKIWRFCFNKISLWDCIYSTDTAVVQTISEFPFWKNCFRTSWWAARENGSVFDLQHLHVVCSRFESFSWSVQPPASRDVPLLRIFKVTWLQPWREFWNPDGGVLNILNEDNSAIEMITFRMCKL